MNRDKPNSHSLLPPTPQLEQSLHLSKAFPPWLPSPIEKPATVTNLYKMFRKHLNGPKPSKRLVKLSNSIASSVREMTRRHSITCPSTKPVVTDTNTKEPPSPPRQSSVEETTHVFVAHQESFHEQQSSNSYGLITNELDSFSESSKPSLQYQLFTASQGHMDQGLVDSGKYTNQDIDNGASCPQHATRTPIQDRVGVAADEALLSQKFDIHNSLHDMLSGTTPAIIDEKSAKHFHDLLLPYRLNPRHIVIDSDCPTVAPYIIITRPDDMEELLAPGIAFNNRINDQWMRYLFIPRTFPWPCWPFQLPHSLHPSHAAQHNASYACEELQLQAEGLDSFLFDPTQNQQVVDNAEHANLSLNHAATVQQRQHFSEAAVTASLRAAEFRASYDDPGFAESIERPYRWIDPAEVIFETMHTYPTIIPSPNPFTAPHLVIDQAPPQAIPDNNSTNIQDCNAGNCLVVPSTRHVRHHYTNEYAQIILDQYPVYEDRDTDSSWDSPLPQTPTELLMTSSGEFGDLFHSEMHLYDDFLDDGCLRWQQRGYFDPETSAGSSEIPLGRTSVKFFLQGDEEEETEEEQIAEESFDTTDDDEDGPPPFDEWYLDAIKTHNLPLTPSISNILQTAAT